MNDVITEQAIEWKYNDGGRRDAGFKGSTGDCVVRAIAIATPMTYLEAYELINIEASRERPRGKRKRSSARTGVNRRTIHRMLTSMGFEWTPTMGIGTGCRVHLRANELPSGVLIVSLSRHVCAVLNRVVYDTHDPSRAGSRCVYGYWKWGTECQNA